MSKPAVAFVWRRLPPPHFLGGAERSAQILGTELAKNGWRVFHVGTRELPWASETFGRVYGLHDHSVPYRWNKQDIYDLPQAEIVPTLEHLIKAQNVRCVVTSHEGSDDIVRIARARGAKTIGWLHSVTSSGLSVLRGDPDLALAVSSFVKNSALPHCSGNLELFYPAFEQVAGQRPRSPFPEVMMVGAIPEKGLDLTLALARALPNIQFVIVEGWYQSTLPKIGNLKYIPRGPLSDYYDSSWLLIVPSKADEGFGRVAVEASLRKRPVLASNRGGLPEAVSHIPECLVDTDKLDRWLPRMTRILNDQPYADQLTLRLNAGAQSFSRSPVPEFERFVNRLVLSASS